MKASGIVYLVLKGLPTPVGIASHWPRSGGKDVYEAERALAREEATHAFLSQLIRARALLRLGRIEDPGYQTCEDVWRARRNSTLGISG
jgi:hypothetical protein